MDNVFDANYATALLIKDRKVLLLRDSDSATAGFLITMVEAEASPVETAAKALRENLKIIFNDADLTRLKTVQADLIQDRAYILEDDIFTLTAWQGELELANPTVEAAEIRWATITDLESGIADNIFNGYIIEALKEYNLID